MTPALGQLFGIVRAGGRRSGPDDRLEIDRRGVRRQQYRRLRRAGDRHDGRARGKHSFDGGISDRRQPGRARGLVGADHPAAGAEGRDELPNPRRAARRSWRALRNGQADRGRVHQPARRQGDAGGQAGAIARQGFAREGENQDDDLFLFVLEECRRPRRSAAPARSSARSATTCRSTAIASRR